MEVYRRVFCSLKVNSEDLARLNSTVKAFEDACNYASEVAFKKGIHKHKVLHDRIYRELRAIFKLSAALAVRVIQKVGTVSKASEKRIFRDLLSRLIDQIEEPAPGFA
jgi:predicted transposase